MPWVRTPSIDRFWRFVIVAECGCWLWTGCIHSNGYPAFNVPDPNGSHRNKKVYAHRWAYEYYVGPIPDGHELDHQCHNRDVSCSGGAGCHHRRCVNPLHTEPAIHLINARRGRGGDWQRAKTHCPQGHPYNTENTRAWGRAPRRCRECNKQKCQQRARALVASAQNAAQVGAVA